MNKKIVTIAVDAMGSHDPSIVFRGLTSALQKNPNLRFRLYGKQDVISPILDSYSLLKENSVFFHASVALTMDDKPAAALRIRRKTSMWQALCACRDGKAETVMTAGNTGALVALSRFALGLLAGFSNPVLMAHIPHRTKKKTEKSFEAHDHKYILDVGGHYEASHTKLIKMALISAQYLYALYHHPIDVGLLNLGKEEKGPKRILLAHTFLQDFQCKEMNYLGLVEPSFMLEKKKTLIVTDGFSGNVLVKSLEVSAQMIRMHLSSSFWKRLFVDNFIRGKIERHLFALVQGVNGFVFKLRESSKAHTYEHVALQSYLYDRKKIAQIAASATENNEIVKDAFKDEKQLDDEAKWSSSNTASHAQGDDRQALSLSGVSCSPHAGTSFYQEGDENKV